MAEGRHRVLMTVDPIGGVWTYALTLARGLTRAGGAVALASMGAPLTSSQECEARGIAGVDLFVSEYKLEWMDDPWRDVDAAGAWLLNLARDWEPDVIHLNGYAHAALPWSQPVLVVAHSCVLSWWAAVRGDTVPAKYDEYRRRVAAGLAAADAVAAPTRAMLEALSAHYGAAGRRSVVPNGAGEPALRRVPRDRVILSAGRLWDPAKNTELLVNIADQLPWRVALAGESRSPAGEERRWRPATMLGRLGRDALEEHYARCGLYALPATYEPFGLSVLEAAQQGAPLVLADIASLRELWDGAAVFVHPRSPAAWVETLCRLAESEDRRLRLGEAARRRAARYTDRAMVRRYQEIYDHMLLPRNVQSLACL